MTKIGSHLIFVVRAVSLVNSKGARLPVLSVGKNEEIINNMICKTSPDISAMKVFLIHKELAVTNKENSPPQKS
ncbi:hypothetical protein MAQA_09284 [Listeria aquatica FSL S10-1188]|uniref:Uncharacterized protein n=1 Tax=Listeria aquatica FSL S10-1188 TaxID=1265818 RepID=W7AYV3_9LIST|nr:hypothetical protein MAQA_09284 [Listeria aquatica FSL S10-1188]